MKDGRTGIILVALFLAGCQPTDYAAEKVADGVRRYCTLSETGRKLVREKISPYLPAGHSVDIDCPGD